MGSGPRFGDNRGEQVIGRIVMQVELTEREIEAIYEQLSIRLAEGFVNPPTEKFFEELTEKINSYRTPIIRLPVIKRKTKGK